MKRFFWLGIVLIIGLICIALLFSLNHRDWQIRQNNQKLIKQWTSQSHLEFNKSRQLQFNWRDVILKVVSWKRKDITTQETMADIIKNQNYITQGNMLRDMLRVTSHPLKPLESIQKDIIILNSLGISTNIKITNEINNWLLFLGEKKTCNYLVLIQDPTIPRPSGGVLGDYCILSFAQGKTTWQCGSVLDLDDLFIKQIIPPLPLQFVSNKWFFHDLNWFFDFPTTGREINQFYNDLDNDSLVDGVIIINPSVVEDILSITGPISISKYGITLNSDNFSSFFQQEIRQSVRFNNLNKIIYSRKIPSLLFKAINSKISSLSIASLNNLTGLIRDDLNSKDIQVYAQDDTLEYYFNNLGWTGSIKPVQNDYLAVTMNNLQRVFTTDQRQKFISLSSQFTPSGVINTLTIKAGGRSKEENYLQIYLPSGVSILQTQNNYLKTFISHWPYSKLGFSHDPDVSLIEQTKIVDLKHRVQLLSEGNKTVVTTWAKLSQQPFILKYKIPFNRMPSKWDIAFQKQSGQIEYFNYKIDLPQQYKIQPNLFPLGKFIPVNNDLNVALEFTHD